MSYNNDCLSGEVNRAGFRVDIDQFDRSKMSLGMSYVLAQWGNNNVGVTGTVAETTFADRTVIIPGGLLGPNGGFRLSLYLWGTANANVKTVRAKLAGVDISGSTLNVASASGAYGIQRDFRNRGAENANRWFGNSGSGSTFGNAITMVDTTIDTSVDCPLTVTAQLAVGTDQILIGMYLLEVFPSM